MNLTNFLLVDIIILLIAIPFIIPIKNKRKESKGLSRESDGINYKQEYLELPSKQKLLELEILAREEGSGIIYDSIIGVWKFESVWKKGTNDQDPFSSSLLRLFSASLELKIGKSRLEEKSFEIINSIKYGILTVRFIGSGNLKGSQPLLPFFFERIELNLGKNVVFSRSLNIPQENQKPFFALIGIGKNGKWLSARGRAGGLALWLKGE